MALLCTCLMQSANETQSFPPQYKVATCIAEQNEGHFYYIVLD